MNADTTTELMNTLTAAAVPAILTGALFLLVGVLVVLRVNHIARKTTEEDQARHAYTETLNAGHDETTARHVEIAVQAVEQYRREQERDTR